MQHDALPIVLEALLDVEPGTPEPVHGDVQTVPLLRPHRSFLLAEQPGAVVADDAELIWSEQAPAQPRRVRVRNPSPGSVIVDAGTVLQGGMSARAVSRTVVVAPGPAVPVSVEPLGARWWDEGPLRVRGRLGAVAAGLLLQAACGEPSVARSALTALWSLPDGGRMVGFGDRQGVAAPATGWVIVLGGEVVAVWLPDRGGASAYGRRSGEWAVGRTGAVSLSASISRGVEGGKLAAHVLRHATAVRDLVVVSRDLRLVDHVTAVRQPDVVTQRVNRV